MTRKLRVELLQLPAPDFRGQTLTGNVPLAGGYLKAAAHHRGLLDQVDIEILGGRETNTFTDSQLISHVIAKSPDIVGFSIYLWNSLRSLYVARALKESLPNLVVIVGGPEVTRDTDYIYTNPAVDAGCLGEGERTFVEFLEQQLSGRPDFAEIDGFFYKESGETVFTAPASPIEDLGEIPSPYALGYIDPRVHFAIPYVGIRGCPHRCEYCTDANVAMRRVPSDRMLEDVQLFIDRGVHLLRFWDSDFLLHRPEFIEQLSELNRDQKLRMTCFFRAERLNERRADLLARCNFELVEFGLQTMNAETLANVGRRPIGTDKLAASIELLRQRKLDFVADLIFGLPCDTLDDLKNNLMVLGRCGVGEISYSVLILLPGTRVRQRAEEFGIQYESGPPHRFIEAPYLTRDELEEAKRVIVFDKTPYRPPFGGLYTVSTGVSLLRESQADFPRRAAGKPTPAIEVDRAGAGINKVLLDLDHTQQTAEQLREVGEKLVGKVVQPLTFWFRSADLDGDASLMSAVLAPIAAANPFLIWNLVFETDQPVAPETLSALGQSLPTRATRFDYLQLYKAVSMRVVAPPPVDARDREWMAAVNEEVALFWSVEVSASSAWRETLSDLYQQELCDGLLIDFDPGAELSFVAEVLRFLVAKKAEQPQKELRFRNRVVDFMFYSVQAAAQSEAPPSAFAHTTEYIVAIDRGLKMRSVLTPFTETRTSILRLQLKLAALLEKERQVQ